MSIEEEMCSNRRWNALKLSENENARTKERSIVNTQYNNKQRENEEAKVEGPQVWREMTKVEGQTREAIGIVASRLNTILRRHEKKTRFDIKVSR